MVLQAKPASRRIHKAEEGGKDTGKGGTAPVPLASIILVCHCEPYYGVAISKHRYKKLFTKISI